jgi:hypothetical protein
VLGVIEEMVLPLGAVANTGVPLERAPVEENTRAFSDTAPAWATEVASGWTATA